MSEFTKKDDYHSLWCAALEMFCHQVLYIRRIYPQDTFCHTRFLGVQCRANRHPGVVDYISETVRLVVSAILKGDSDEVSLVLFDQADTMVQHEKYSLNFGRTPTQSSILELEREIRDLILSVRTLEGLDPPAWSPSATFKILLYLPTEKQNCTELNEALADGEWFCPDSDSSRAEEKRRPLFQMAQSTCNFYFQTKPAESMKAT
jgi:hypothetical protein